MTAFMIGFVAGAIFEATVMILWALCQEQENEEEKGDTLTTPGGGARMPEKRLAPPPKR